MDIHDSLVCAAVVVVHVCVDVVFSLHEFVRYYFLSAALRFFIYLRIYDCRANTSSSSSSPHSWNISSSFPVPSRRPARSPASVADFLPSAQATDFRRASAARALRISGASVCIHMISLRLARMRSATKCSRRAVTKTSVRARRNRAKRDGKRRSKMHFCKRRI